MWIDSHCHLTDERLEPQVDSLLERMHLAKVDAALVISTTLEDARTVLALTAKRPNLFATVGVHPEQADATPPSADDLCTLAASSSKVMAIGETGLDYYWHKGERSELQWQRDRFSHHIEAAKRCNKPLVVHTRNASADTLEMLQSEQAHRCGGVIHCFTETWQVAKAALDMGFYISFSGIVTFKNAADLREVALKIPADRILVETDAPYLAPTPHRGKNNEPAFVSHVGHFVAQLRGASDEDFAQCTSNNFWHLFDPTGKHRSNLTSASADMYAISAPIQAPIPAFVRKLDE
jgi:TatD DNase family protein